MNYVTMVLPILCTQLRATNDDDVLVNVAPVWVVPNAGSVVSDCASAVSPLFTPVDCL